MDYRELESSATYGDLVRLHDENCEPFDSVAQCKLFLRVASRLRRMTPEETNHSANSIKTRDLLDSIGMARKYLAVQAVRINQRPTVIVPKDNLQ